MKSQLAQLTRKVENMIRIGIIAEVDHTKALCRVQYDVDADNNPIISNWRPWIVQRAGDDATWWAPSTGEQVTMLSPSGELALAIVLPSLYQTAKPAPGNAANKHITKYKDGAVIEYDHTAHSLKATLPSGGTTELFSDGGVTITGPVDIVGPVTMSETLEVASDTTVGGSATIAMAVNAQSAAIVAGVTAAAVSINNVDFSSHVHHENDMNTTTGGPQ